MVDTAATIHAGLRGPEEISLIWTTGYRNVHLRPIILAMDGIIPPNTTTHTGTEHPEIAVVIDQMSTLTFPVIALADEMTVRLGKTDHPETIVEDGMIGMIGDTIGIGETENMTIAVELVRPEVAAVLLGTETEMFIGDRIAQDLMSPEDHIEILVTLFCLH